MRITHNTRQILACLAASGLLCALQAQTPSQGTRSITLTEALTAATQNIDAKIAKQQLLGARADVLAANHAPLPTLSTSLSQIDLQNGVGAGSWIGEKRVNTSIGVDWMWERGGKRALRTEAAKQAVNASTQDVRETLTLQKIAAQSAFFDLLAAQERITQVTAIADSAKALSSATSKRLAAGDLSAQDAARSSIEAQRAQNDVTLAEQERARAELALNLVLDVGAQKLVAARSGLGTSAGMDSRLRGNDKSGGNEGSGRNERSGGNDRLLIDSRADVQAASARVETAKAQLNNALALKSNDITLGTAIDHFPGTSNRLLMFRMQMPLQLGAVGGYSFQGEIDRASAQLAIAEAQLDRTRHAATNDQIRLTQELASSQTRAKSYADGIAPAAKRVADQAELAYNKGALSLTDLLEARRTWRATTLEAIAAQTDFDKAQTAYLIRSESLK
jgi:outer membrane protein, heavy metal efflux system